MVRVQIADSDVPFSPTYSPLTRARSLVFDCDLTRDLSSVRGHSAHAVAISNAEPNYPVVILRAGGSGSALNYSSLAEDLGSHGYVVVGLDFATTANPELCAGRNDAEDCATKIMAPLTSGIGRALDRLEQLTKSDERFKSRLDLTRVGVFRSLLRRRAGRAVLLAGQALHGRHRYRWSAVWHCHYQWNTGAIHVSAV
jgi:hypothetical protein